MPLEVQIGGNTRGFEVAMARAQAVAAVGAMEIRRRFEHSAEGIASAFAKRLIVPAVAVAGFIALKLAIDAVTEAVQKQVKQILEIADQANKVGVNAGFFQAFLSASQNLRVEAKQLEQALGRAFQAFKDKIDPDWTVFEQGNEKLEAFRVKLLEVQQLFAEGQKFTAPILFRDAKDQEERIKAAITAAIELEAIGQRLAALDIVEQVFGSQMADNIRQGNIQMTELLASLEKAPRFSAELVAQTKEVDLELQRARNTLDQELTPTYEKLIALTNDMKSGWTAVISTISSGIATLNEWSRISGGSISRLLAVKAGLVPALGGPETQGATFDQRFAPGQNLLPLPRPRPRNAPEAQAEDEITATKDALDRAIDSANRHATAMSADAETVGLNAAAHEKLKTTMGLYLIAAQNGITVNAELAARIQQAADNAGGAADKLERARVQLNEINSASRDIGSALAEAFKGATLEGKKLNEVMANLLNRLASRSIDKVFDLFFAASSPGGTSLFGGLLRSFTGQRALGGPVTAGSPYIVGEKGPEFFVPRTSGSIVPNGAMGAITYAPNITISGSSTVTQEQLALVLANERANVVPIIRNAMLRRAM